MRPPRQVNQSAEETRMTLCDGARDRDWRRARASGRPERTAALQARHRSKHSVEATKVNSSLAGVPPKPAKCERIDPMARHRPEFPPAVSRSAGLGLRVTWVFVVQSISRRVFIFLS